MRQSLDAMLIEARELKRQAKLLQPRLLCLRREHELLSDAVLLHHKSTSTTTHTDRSLLVRSLRHKKPG